MTAPVTVPATAGDEAPCSDCIASKGLCRAHLRHELPQLAAPSWVKLIGEPYVCTDVRCEEHFACIDVIGAASPRAECGCHNCSQKRWERARARQERESDHSDAFIAALERKKSARRPKRVKSSKSSKSSRGSERVERFVGAIHGARSPNRRGRRARTGRSAA